MQDLRSEFRAALLAGATDEAFDLAQTQLRLEGESAAWMNALGWLYVTQGRFAEALGSFDRAAALDPEDVESLLNGAILLSDLGFYEEAAVRYEAVGVIETRGLSPEALSELNLRRGALPHPDGGLSLRQRIAEKQTELATLCQHFGRSTQAEQEFLRAVSTYPHADTHLAYARFLLGRTKAEAALQQLELARRADSRHPEVHALAIQCYLMLGRAAEAQESVAKLELLQDEHPLLPVFKRLLGSPPRAGASVKSFPLPGDFDK